MKKEETTEGLIPFIDRTKDLPKKLVTKSVYEVVVPVPQVIHEMMAEIQATSLNHHQILSQIDQLIRDMSFPPIKGKITPGKIKWRGLRIVQVQGTGKRYVTQRGKKIVDLPDDILGAIFLNKLQDSCNQKL